MCGKRALCFVVVLLVVALGSAGARGRYHAGKQGHKRLLRTFRGLGPSSTSRRSASAPAPAAGLWPAVFNLATKASVRANATCGERGREEFCRLAEGGRGGPGRCGVCDARAADQHRGHPARHAVDGGARWWQSPALHYGAQYERVTVTVDLKQVYQIAYIILKAANSPRPGTWVLERSLDGETYEPWQYFARNDKECLERFGIPATKGKPRYTSDTEVICTSYFSKLTPLENGEVHISLVNGRPGANETSPELLEFTKARFVRFRFMGLRGTVEPVPKWLSQDIWKNKRLFYSIRDISIGGQCVCNGHADNCRYNVASGHPECECQHGTCGPNCDRCCPLFNQRRWLAGTARDANVCLPCNCHGHAESCHYDGDVDLAGLSLDPSGKAVGGGVCDDCKDFTTGVNCEKCLPGHYRPPEQDATKPCVPCDCDSRGSTGNCVQYGKDAGLCECKLGYTGTRCDSCSEGYKGFPRCETCPCDPKGSLIIPENCQGDCVCKTNVDGKFCDSCKSGYFGLKSENLEGCLSCYCSGVTTLCEIAAINPQKIETLEQWLMSDLPVSHTLVPQHNGDGVFSVGGYEATGGGSLYWLAPSPYLGNRLESYGGNLTFEVQWVVMRGDTSGETTTGPNVVIVGDNGMRIGYGDGIYTSQRKKFNVPLTEDGWYIIPDNVTEIKTSNRNTYNAGPVSRKQFLDIFMKIRHILLRGTFHTDQIEALLQEASMQYGNENENYEKGNVEKCSCPSGYTGLSCESCGFGYVRVQANATDATQRTLCGKCDCNGHSRTCNSDTGECFCEHHTMGSKCERCIPGYYGNPFRGTPDDCKRCACPLENDENNFSPSCQLDYSDGEREFSYVCTQCPKGYTGDHCEICDDGYYGNPLEVGNNCKPCDCSGGPCNRTTGQCLGCKGNTEGWKCERCKAEHYGDPAIPNCKLCECNSIGSSSKQCDNITGQCHCKEKFVGRTCDRCEIGYGNVTALCLPCSCSPVGSISQICDPHTGICPCQPGVDGFHCDSCQNLHYGFSETGCKGKCNFKFVLLL